MAPRPTRQQKTVKATKTTSKHNEDDTYVSKYVIKSDDDNDGYVSKYALKESAESKDRASSMESATTVTSAPDSKCSGSTEQGTPPPPAPVEEKRTSLKSLKSKAKMFVPTDQTFSDASFAVPDPAMMAMPCMQAPWMPSPGKDYLASVITTTLGMELWDLNFMDFTGYNGEWCTAVEITVPELTASMCHLAVSQDAEAVAAAKTANSAQVVQSLTQAFKDCGSDMVLDLADHRAQICVDVCPANGRTPCREFSHTGACPRGGSCHFAHAMFESFMINLIMAPLAQFGFELGTGTQAANTSGSKVPEPKSPANKPSSYESRWQPKRAPKPVTEVVLEKEQAVESPKKEVVVDLTFEPIKSNSAPEISRRKSSSLRERKQKWSDILDDSDED